MSTHELPAEAIKLMVDLSTMHMTASDVTLCAAQATEIDRNDLPRMVEHGFGYIVFVTGDPQLVPEYLDALRKTGFSEAFLDIYDRAARSENTVMLINFDRDAANVDGLPIFEW